MRKLAGALRVFTRYEAAPGLTIEASDASLLRLIRGLGYDIQHAGEARAVLERVEAERASRRLDPVTVAWIGKGAHAALRIEDGASGRVGWSIRTEDGRTIDGDSAITDLETVTRRTRTGVRATFALVPLPGSTSKTPSPDQLGMGYHRLTVTHAGESFESLLLCAPRVSYQIPTDEGMAGQRGGKSLGLFCPTYSLRSSRNLGIGDLTDLRELAAWGASRGADLISTLPLLAGFLGGSVFNPGPYAPVTRLFWNELLLDVERCPGFDSCEGAGRLMADADYRRQTQALRRAKVIDYRAVASHKRRVLELISEEFFASGGERSAAFRAFTKDTPQAKEYARFRAVSESRDTAWQDWPTRMQNGSLRPSDCRAEDERYHLYSQFAMHEQLGAFSTEMAQRGGKLYLDLPVGTHASGYDTWKYRGLFMPGSSVGAPPDPVFTAGQNWGFPGLHPEAIREEGYGYFIASLRNHMKHAHFLRLDHVMCFYRLFMIPEGMGAKDGVYIGYEAEEMFAILCIESHRAECRLIGENLGTVPAAIDRGMEKHRIGALYIGQFSINGSKKGKTGTLGPIAANRAASLNTHDLPPFALDLMGGDVVQYIGIGDAAPRTLESTAASWSERSRSLVQFLSERGYCGAKPSAEEVAAGFNRYIAESDAELQLVNVEDLWGETRPQNIPGTSDEYPNWRTKLGRTLAEIRRDEELGALIEELARLRSGERVSRKNKPKHTKANRRARASRK